MLTVSMRK